MRVLFQPGMDRSGGAEIGHQIQYIGYETGGFTGRPAKAFDFIPSHCTTGYQFTNDFVVLRDELKPRKNIESGGRVPAPAGAN